MRATVVVFGREPAPGRVKTRLAARLGAHAASEVYAALLAHALSEAAATGWAVTLSLASPPSADWNPGGAAALEVQPEGSLGHRMAVAFARAFAAGFDPVVLVGSDLPLLSRGLLLEAGRLARRRGAALGPALDGGYYLVAQRAPGLDLFRGIPWSSPATLEATLDRARRIGVEPALLPPLPDVDTEADLEDVLGHPCLRPELRHALCEALARGTAARHG